MGSLRPLHLCFRANMQECAVAKAKVRRCDSSIALSPLQLRTFVFASSRFALSFLRSPSHLHTFSFATSHSRIFAQNAKARRLKWSHWNNITMCTHALSTTVTYQMSVNLISIPWFKHGNIAARQGLPPPFFL